MMCFGCTLRMYQVTYVHKIPNSDEFGVKLSGLASTSSFFLRDFMPIFQRPAVYSCVNVYIPCKSIAFTAGHVYI